MAWFRGMPVTLKVTLAIGLACLLASGVYGLAFFMRSPEPTASNATKLRSPNPIPAENASTGSQNWLITASESAGPDIEGYASRTSYKPGTPLTLYVRSSQPEYRVEVYRIGWYAGREGRLVWTSSAIRSQTQPQPTIDPATHMVEARWRASLTLVIPSEWLTGAYLAVLRLPDGRASWVPFVIRETTRRAPILLVEPVTTYEAYNDWGGTSLYFKVLPNGDHDTGGRATEVSFDRPYAEGYGAQHFFGDDEILIAWLERQGYDVGYATSIDLQEDPGLLIGRRAFISIGQDEYWSSQMRDNLTSAEASGVNLAFLGADDMFRHIRFEPSPLGSDRREINYRSTEDPVCTRTPLDCTVQWRDSPTNLPEDALLGAMYECNPGLGDTKVYDPLPWLFADTGLTQSSLIKNYIGYEYDRVFADTTHLKKLWLVFRGNVTCRGVHSVSDAVFGRFPSGAGVFDAGSLDFVCMLRSCSAVGAQPSVPSDARVQKLLNNLLAEYLRPTPVDQERAPKTFSVARAYASLVHIE